MSTAIFLEYVKQKTWAHKTGNSLVGYEAFLKLEHTYSVNGVYLWVAAPQDKGWTFDDVGNPLSLQSANSRYGAKS